MVLYELAEDKGWKEGTDWTYVNIPSSESKTALISKQVDAISAHPLTDIAAMLQNLDEASTIVEGVSRVPANISKFAWDRMGTAWSSNTDLKEIESETKTMQDWLVAHGDIASDKQVEVSKLFASQYFDQ